MRKSRDIIIHIHIFKNGGTTFDNILRNNFGEEFIEHRDDTKLREDSDFIKKFAILNPTMKAFSSHAVYYRPENFDSVKFHNIVFIRHPIERMKSVYNFERLQPSETSLGAQKAKELDFSEYISWRMQNDAPATVRNSQSIFLAGKGPRISMVTPTVFASASSNLLKNDFTGIVDRYEESMVVLEEQLQPIFGDIDLSFIKANVTDDDTDRSTQEKVEDILASLPKKLAEKAIEKNLYDMKLYKMVNELLDIKISTIADFENKLENFRYRCGLKKLEMLAGENSWEEMANEAKELLRNQNANILVYLKYAEALTKLERYKESNKICEKSMEIFPSNPWTFVAMIRNYKALNNQNICNNLLSEMSYKFPQDENALSIAKDIIR